MKNFKGDSSYFHSFFHPTKRLCSLLMRKLNLKILENNSILTWKSQSFDGSAFYEVASGSEFKLLRLSGKNNALVETQQ